MTPSKFPAEYVEQDGIFAPKDRPISWGYSDGEGVEERIVSIVKDTPDISCLSPDLRKRMTDWATQYHLTPRRANLMRPIEHLFKGRILEVGAGCGAITRFLGETGADVFAVEGSPRRARAARARTRDLPNVTVIVDNAENVEFEEKFSVVTLIGVLEYARIYVSGDDPIDNMLQTLRSRLAPGGALVIAIENQLGLKYFAGAKEDHTARRFFGIEDLYTDKTVVTFGKVELQRRLKAAGFQDCQWLYPFPDYKLPTTVLSEEAFTSGHDLSDLFAGSNFDDPQAPQPATFSLEQAWRPIARNGLAGDLANSFLIVCRAEAPSKKASPTSGPLAWHYSVDRHPAFAKQAVFETGLNGLTVRRKLLSGATPPDGPLHIHLADEPFATGKLWSGDLGKILNKPGWTADQVGQWLGVWRDALLADARLERPAKPGSLDIPGSYLDALPFNLVFQPDGKAHFIDLEWVWDEALPLPYLAYRALSKSLWRVTSCAKPARRRHLTAAFLMQDALRQIGITVDINTMRSFEERERALASIVASGVARRSRPSPLRFYARRLKVRSGHSDSLPTKLVRRVRRMMETGKAR